MEESKKNLNTILIMVGAMLACLVICEWLVVSGNTKNEALYSIYSKMAKQGMLLRGIYVLMSGLLCYFLPGNKLRNSMTENWKVFIVSFAILFTALLIIGPIGSFFYNNYIYGTTIMLQLPFLALAMLSFRTGRLKNESYLGGVSCKKSDFYFEFQTEQGPLRFHQPDEGIWIDGGTGSGKSDTFIKSIIRQAAERGYAGWVYDWEGDPTQVGSPILGKIAYGSLMAAKKKNPNMNLEFAFINFTDMYRTNRVNVLSSRYLSSNNASLIIRNIIITLMKNLEPSWKEKTDFWANNAISYVFSIAYKCYKERDKGINTLPHVISIALSDCDSVFRWIKDDKEISKNMAAMISAWELGAQQQTAGAVSSAQLPLQLLNNPYIYWVLSPSYDEELSLDITNPNRPILLCVGNAPSISEAVSPAISCIGNVVMNQMNQPGKVPSIFQNDEFPTITLYGIDKFISTVRKHKVSTILGLQNKQQANANYGEKSADILQSNCGNHAFGKTGNAKTAESIEKLMGEQKEINISYTEQESGGSSSSQSLQKEKVLKMRDIAGQRTGHFFVKVSNGEPVYQSVQFERDAGISMDIPPFSKMYNTGDEVKDKEIMDSVIQSNYERIEKEVEELLSQTA